MFSSRHYGRLPGLDVAFLLDGAAYHTDRDTVDRIRRGTLQAMGDNVVAAVPEFARQLQHHETQPDSADDESTNVFFDLYGLYMVCIPSHAYCIPSHAYGLLGGDHNCASLE